MKRKKMSRKASKREFRKASGVNKKNLVTTPMRGGIRL